MDGTCNKRGGNEKYIEIFSQKGTSQDQSDDNINVFIAGTRLQ